MDADADRDGREGTDRDGTSETDRSGADRDDTAGGVDPLVRSDADVTYESVEAAEGLRKGVLVGPEDGAPTFALRRFELAPGAEVPRHTNAVEHEQYVLAGEYVVGIGETEHRVSAGDSLLIPAGTVHWYRNDTDRTGAFLCAVPNGDDAIELLE
jgi:quercetin dioxygenase-like cupin family protein